MADPGRLKIKIELGKFHRIIAKDCLAVIVPLPKPNGLAVTQVDCGPDFQVVSPIPMAAMICQVLQA